jgi:hypothetical protein
MKKLIEKIKYRFDQFLSKGTVSLVLSLFFAMILIVVLVGVLANIFSSEINLSRLIWISFMQTLDAGNLSGEEGSIAYMLLMTIATLVGIFITSLFISFILNGFQTKLEKLSRGRSKVCEKNHTLILGWNEFIYVLLEELIASNRSLKKPVIVILSDVDSVEMNQLIKDNISNVYNTRIICRTGSIFKSTDLDMCNIVEARSIIINENDLNTIKSLLVVVNSEYYQKGKGHICALMYDDLNISVAKQIGKDKLEVIYLKSAITRIIAQTCLQPGLSYVYNELLEFAGVEIYFYMNDNLINKKFSQIQRMFEESIVIGIKKENNVLIKPDNNIVYEKNDSLIVISEDENTIVLNEKEVIVDLASIKDISHRTSVKKSCIFTIGFNTKTLSVIEEFDSYLAKESEITVLVNSDEHLEKLEALDKKLDRIDIKGFVGDTYSREVLDKYVTKQVSSIIIFSNENVEFLEKDSQTLLSLLHLRDIEEKLNTNFDIITEIADVRNSEIVDLAKVDDFIISELMANKMLAQVSENRYLKNIFEHLLSDEGSEIYLKPILDYVDISKPLNFYTLVQAAIQKDEVAIGYKISKKDHLPEIILNPNKSQKIQFTEKDCLIVISED